MVLERHQTLPSTIDWSYDLLEPTERHALNRLSVFAGGCDLAAAVAVLAGDEVDDFGVVDLLGQLVDKSLVVADDNDDGGVRYRLLESVRQYAEERLEADGAAAELRRRHADYYVELAETAGPHLRTRSQLDWIKVVAAEIDNFRAAFDWAIETPSIDHAFRLIAPFTLSLAIGDTAMDWSATASTLPGGRDHPLFAVVAAWAAWRGTFSGDFERAEAHASSWSRHSRRWVSDSRRLRTSGQCSRSCGAISNRSWDTRKSGWTSPGRREMTTSSPWRSSCLQARAMNEPEVAVATLEESVRVARDAGIVSALSIGLPMLAGILPVEQSARALALLDEAVEAGRLVGDRWSVRRVTGTKVVIALQRGEWRLALQLTLDLIDIDVALALADVLFGAAIALGRLGRFEAAAVVLGRADAMASRRGGMQWTLDLVAATDHAILAALGEEHAATLAARGAALDYADAVTYLRAQVASIPGPGDDR